MPFAPYQWRAGKGYIPSPDAVPQLITMPAGPTLYAYPYGAPSPLQYAHLIAHPSMPQVVATAPPPKKKSVSLPPAPAPPASAAPSKASSGPKTIIQGKDWRIVGKPTGSGKWTITIPPPPPPPSAAPKKITIPPPPPCSTISPADSVSSTGSGTSLGSSQRTCCKSKSKTTTQVTKKSSSGSKSGSSGTSSSKPPTAPKTKLNLQLRGGGSTAPPPHPPSVTATATPATAASTCPTLRPGTNYMFPPRDSHTILHIFNKARPVWEAKYQGAQMEFKMFKVAVKFSVREVVQRVVGRHVGEEDLQKWCVTECHEQGGGVWKKGTTISYASDRAAGSLESMGWDVKRGKERSPVWLVVHKA